MPVRLRLVGFNPLSLNIEIGVYGTRDKIKSISVTDCKKNHVKEVHYDQGQAADVVRLGNVARTRFPLFIEIEETDGNMHSVDEVGPIFPAPTQVEYVGGIQLPLHAVDTLNDPTIRELRRIVTTGEIRKALLDGNMRGAYRDIRWTLSRGALVLSVGSVLAAIYVASMIISGNNTVTTFLAFGVVGALVVFAVRQARKLKSGWADIRQHQNQSKKDLKEYEDAIQELINLGVYRKVVQTNDNKSCSCS